jgi:hypothetical protein
LAKCSSKDAFRVRAYHTYFPARRNTRRDTLAFAATLVL